MARRVFVSSGADGRITSAAIISETVVLVGFLSGVYGTATDGSKKSMNNYMEARKK